MGGSARINLRLLLRNASKLWRWRRRFKKKGQKLWTRVRRKGGRAKKVPLCWVGWGADCAFCGSDVGNVPKRFCDYGRTTCVLKGLVVFGVEKWTVNVNACCACELPMVLSGWPRSDTDTIITTTTTMATDRPTVSSPLPSAASIDLGTLSTHCTTLTGRSRVVPNDTYMHTLQANTVPHTGQGVKRESRGCV